VADPTFLDGQPDDGKRTHLEQGARHSRPADTVMEGVHVTPASVHAGFQPLPPTLVDAGYRLVRQLGTGAEATVWLCTDGSGGEVAVKVYFRTPTYVFELNSADYQQHFSPAWVVQIFERGCDQVPGGEMYYEVMEYCSHGTLEELVGARVCSDDLATHILAKLAWCIKSLHGDRRNVVHGDIKPRNVLVRDPSGPELILADFGLAIDLGERSNLSNNGQGTTAYNAPEIMRIKGAPADWWSLGMVMYTMLVGRGYYQLDQDHWANQRAIEADLISRDISLAGIEKLEMPTGQRNRWMMLFGGLLTRDPDSRWDATQIEAWLAGGSPPVYRPLDAAVADPAASADGGRHAEPFAFAGVGEFRSAAELGGAMAAQPRDAARMLSGKGTDRLVEWLRNTARTGDDYSELADHRWDPDAKVTYFVAALAPNAPLTFRSRPIATPADIRRLVQDGDNDTVDALYQADLLPSLANGGPRSGYRMIEANWHDIVDRATEASRARGIPLSDAASAHICRQALLLAASDATVAEHYVTEVRRRITALGPQANEVDWFARLRADAGL
jgi:serine/threonine protein kinase